MGAAGDEQTAVGPLMAVMTGAWANIFAKKEHAKNRTNKSWGFFIF
jgi:hypothetical protein